MCERFVLNSPPAELVTRCGLDECADFGSRYNIPPGTDIPAIRLSPDDQRVLRLLRRGLVSHRAKEATIYGRT